MNTLARPIASSTGQVWEAIAVTALAFVLVRSGQPVRSRQSVYSGKPMSRSSRSKSRHLELDRHTKRDIGLEPGSITWL
jgi:hypothetical protein